jgi:pilus assembly protein CpaE
VIDNGQSIDASSGQIFKHSHIVVLVTVLSLPCLVNVKKLLDMFLYSRYMPLDRLRVVVTRYSKKSEITLKDAEKSINMKIFHAVVNDFYSSMSAINQGKTVSEVAPKSDLCKSIKELTEALFSVTKDNGRVGGLKSLLSGSKVFKS